MLRQETVSRMTSKGSCKPSKKFAIGKTSLQIVENFSEKVPIYTFYSQSTNFKKASKTLTLLLVTGKKSGWQSERQLWKFTNGSQYLRTSRRKNTRPNLKIKKTHWHPRRRMTRRAPTLAWQKILTHVSGVKFSHFVTILFSPFKIFILFQVSQRWATPKAPLSSIPPTFQKTPTLRAVVPPLRPSG